MENTPGMQILFALFLFLPGLFAGSFLSKIICRTPYGIRLWPASSCPACECRIAARDTVPVIGWLLLRGACRSCRAPISWRYPVLETVTGLAWGIQGWRFYAMPAGWESVGTLTVDLAFVCCLLVTAVIDWDCFIILDEISIGGAVASLAASIFLPALHHADPVESYAAFSPELFLLFGEWPAWARGLSASLAGLAVGLGFALAIYWFGNVICRKQVEAAQVDDPDIDSAFGLGDVKLMAFFGAFLGWRAVFSLFFIGALSAALTGVALKLLSGDAGNATGWAGIRRRWHSGDSFFPFGPFLVVGAYCVFLDIL